MGVRGMLTCGMFIRKYLENDREKLIELLRFNTPQYFSLIEEKDLLEYLQHHSSDHYVLEMDGVIVGCGGFTITDDGRQARISWDFFHPDQQGNGLGAALINFRIQKIKEIEGITTITVRTSQFAYKFYEKFGFQLKEVVEDFWDKGYDLYSMELYL